MESVTSLYQRATEPTGIPAHSSMQEDKILHLMNIAPDDFYQLLV